MAKEIIFLKLRTLPLPSAISTRSFSTYLYSLFPFCTSLEEGTVAVLFV